jgi:4-aminobutyrate aminotransferase-like enzyme
VTVARALPKRAARRGAELVAGLRALQRHHPIVREVRGIGLLIAIELRTAAATRRFAAGCLDRGVVLNWTLNRDTVVRLAPPLTISRGEIAHALEVIDAALAEATRR